MLRLTKSKNVLRTFLRLRIDYNNVSFLLICKINDKHKVAKTVI